MHSRALTTYLWMAGWLAPWEEELSEHEYGHWSERDYFEYRSELIVIDARAAI